MLWVPNLPVPAESAEAFIPLPCTTPPFLTHHPAAIRPPDSESARASRVRGELPPRALTGRTG